jgi:hypothetical protein
MEMPFMLLFTCGVDQYIIDEHHDKLVQIFHENSMKTLFIMYIK